MGDEASGVEPGEMGDLAPLGDLGPRGLPLSPAFALALSMRMGALGIIDRGPAFSPANDTSIS